jgi:hypothetical protein
MIESSRPCGFVQHGVEQVGDALFVDQVRRSSLVLLDRLSDGRQPPAEEIMRVYKQVDGKLTELAKHYGKPYGTIQGWASTLREQGYPIGRSRKS